MSEFWTCGPFKDALDRQKMYSFRLEQSQKLDELLEEDKNNRFILENGTPDEKMLAAMIQQDIDKKIAIILGIPYGNEEENNEILGKTILELINQGTTDKVG